MNNYYFNDIYMLNYYYYMQKNLKKINFLNKILITIYQSFKFKMINKKNLFQKLNLLSIFRSYYFNFFKNEQSIYFFSRFFLILKVIQELPI